jgi:hypothetical protein
MLDIIALGFAQQPKGVTPDCIYNPYVFYTGRYDSTRAIWTRSK